MNGDEGAILYNDLYYTLLVGLNCCSLLYDDLYCSLGRMKLLFTSGFLFRKLNGSVSSVVRALHYLTTDENGSLHPLLHVAMP